MKLVSIDLSRLESVNGGSVSTSFSVRASTSNSNTMAMFMMAAMLMRPQNNYAVRYVVRY